MPGLKALLCQPSVAAIAVTSFVARLPKGVVPLATVALLQHSHGYAVAGLAAAAVTVGDAVSAPWQGRQMDRHGRAPVLLPSVGLHVLAVVALVLGGRSDAASPWLLLAALVAGLGMPPVSGSVKSVWAQLTGPADRPVAYTLESLIQQAIFSVGPLLVALVGAVAGPPQMLLASAAAMTVGVGGYLLATAGLPPVSAAPTGHGALRRPVVRRLVLATLVHGTVFGSLPVVFVALATAADVAAWAGVLQAGLSVGGLLGSLVAVPAVSARRYAVLLAVSGLGLTPVVLTGLVPDRSVVLLLAGVLVLPGLVNTPIAAHSYVLLERAAHPRHRTEAFTWLSSALALGTGGGSAAAGWLVEHGGPVAATAAAPLGALAAAGLVWLTLGHACDVRR